MPSDRASATRPLTHPPNNANANKFESPTSSEDISNAAVGLENASLKIAIVGKLRVVCGALNLYHILVHEALVRACENVNVNKCRSRSTQIEMVTKQMKMDIIATLMMMMIMMTVDDDDDDTPSNSNQKVGLDGMYKNHAIVMATAPLHTHPNSGDNDNELKLGDVKIHKLGLKQAGIRYQRSSISSTSGIILDSTKMMIHMSSSLLLLPIKLLVVALRALGHSHNLLRSDKRNEHNSKLIQLQELYGNLRGIGIGEDLTPSPTNDVLWLSDSPLADLGASKVQEQMVGNDIIHALCVCVYVRVRSALFYC